MRYRYSYFAPLILMLFACTDDATDKVVTITFSEKETQALTLSDLDLADISYVRHGESSITVANENLAEAIQIATKNSNFVLPPLLSASVEPKRHSEIKEQLKAKNIEFSEITSSGNVYFVFNNLKDMQTFEVMLNEQLLKELRSLRSKNQTP